MSATQKLFRFGVFELNVTTEELRKSGTLIKLAPQPLMLLALLASRAGQIVSREEIQQQLWGEETYVDFEQGMNHCIKQIRNALSDNADNPLYVETLPRRGYRFLAPVVSKTIPAPAPKVVESKSGIQSSVSVPALTPERIGLVTSSDTSSAVATATRKETAPLPVVSEAKAPPAPRVQPNRVVPKPGSRHGGLSGRMVSIAAAVIVLVAAVLYWQLQQQPKPLTEKDTIVLADFNNTTGEPVFDATLKQALTVDLEQSPFLNVLSDQKVDEQLRYMGFSVETRLTKDVARKVCQRAGSKALLLGSISQLGSQYVLGVQAINCETGDSLGNEQAEASGREQVLRALSKVTASLRQKLGESLASVQKYDVPVEQATTPSLDALKAYSLGIKTANTQGYAASIPYFKQAIDLDPNFAMAYARLGVEYSNLNEPGRAAENVGKAFQLRNQTSERERLYITCHYHDLVTGDVDQAIAAYLLFRQAYPREQWSYINLNSLYNSIGKYDQALAEAQGALQIDPANVGNYINLAVTYSDLNRVNEAKGVLQQARAHDLDPVALLPESYVVAFLLGDVADMAQQVAASAGHPGTEDQLLAMQSDTEAYFGRLGRARELTQAAQSSASNAGLERGIGAVETLRRAARGRTGRPAACAARGRGRGGSRTQQERTDSGHAGPGAKRRQ